MSRYTFAEKALARAAGLEHVAAGQIVDTTPDLMFSHDNSAAIRRIFATIGAPAVRYPERVAITLDHAVPAPTTQHAQNHADIRAWVAEQNIAHHFAVGRGICHQVLSEEGLALPGQLILGADSHSTHFGWLGAFGAGVGRSEMAALWATGRIWLRVPESIRVELQGALPAWVTAKDIALSILGRWGAAGGTYTSVEFAGDGLASLSLDQRAVLPNMMAEFGVMNAYLPPDEAIFAYLAERTQAPYTPLYPDADATYQADYTIDLTTIEPYIAVLDGRRVACRLIIVPASSRVLQQAIAAGYVATLLAAGAVIGVPGCGPCMGNHMGVPAPDEVTISSGNRNFRGRMGTPEAPVYLASPAVVAASAAVGAIAHPSEVTA
jgi:3-isopropylmalate/(R)-2-methylmalate dehydratase large subunit